MSACRGDRWREVWGAVAEPPGTPLWEGQGQLEAQSASMMQWHETPKYYGFGLAPVPFTLVESTNGIKSDWRHDQYSEAFSKLNLYFGDSPSEVPWFSLGISKFHYTKQRTYSKTVISSPRKINQCLPSAPTSSICHVSSSPPENIGKHIYTFPSKLKPNGWLKKGKKGSSQTKNIFVCWQQ